MPKTRNQFDNKQLKDYLASLNRIPFRQRIIRPILLSCLLKMAKVEFKRLHFFLDHELVRI